MNRLQHRSFLYWLGWILALGAPVLDGATRSAIAQDDGSPRAIVGFDAFRLIIERNPFDRNRTGTVRAPVQEAVRPPRIDTIGLVGTLVTETTSYAFFNSSVAEYRAVVALGGSIAGCTVTAIDSASVQLMVNDAPEVLQVGMSMVREERGRWELRDEPISDFTILVKSDQSASGPAVGSETSSPASEPGESSTNDILKKLMERRRQEMDQ